MAKLIKSYMSSFESDDKDPSGGLDWRWMMVAVAILVLIFLK